MRNPKYYALLEGGKIFHVYNRTNNKECMFRTILDRLRFLEQLKRFVRPFCHILSYNLQYNHFHLLIETFTKEKITSTLDEDVIASLPVVCTELFYAEEDNVAEILCNRFSAFFNSYTGVFNHIHGRKGNFFVRPFCRVFVESEIHFKNAVFYINNNSVWHGQLKNLYADEWSSYHDVITKEFGLIDFPKLMDYFGGENSYKLFHKETIGLKKDEVPFYIEDEALEEPNTSEE